MLAHTPLLSLIEILSLAMGSLLFCSVAHVEQRQSFEQQLHSLRRSTP